jgi:prolyl-tRNA synthetase
VGPGFKFKDAELIGYPYQLIIGNKTLENGDNGELVTRKTGEKKMIELSTVI